MATRCPRRDRGREVVSLWPLLIVFFGISVLFGQYRARTHARETADDHPTALALFGGSEDRSTSKTFRGADFTAVFGGVEIQAPREWNVRVDVLPLFGGASDDRPRSDEEHEGVDLVVTGMALFGGVSVS